jgi:hypothetical protein
METKAWIIAVATCALDATFYCGKTLWSKDRYKAKIYLNYKEALAMGEQLDSRVWEVTLGSDSVVRPFRVEAWTDPYKFFKKES